MQFQNKYNYTDLSIFLQLNTGAFIITGMQITSPPSELFKWALNLNNKQDAHGPHRSLEKQFKSINTFAQTKNTLQC